MKIAIVTGASVGLGREFVRQLLAQCTGLDEIWAIARSQDALEALRNEFGDKLVPISLDLTKRQDLETLAARLGQHQIAAVVNNAGIGVLGNFADTPITGQLNMTDLNVTALTAVAHLCLPYMQKGSFVLNVCSIAAFVPTPRMTVYSATKAYVYAFSKSLACELKPRGITVTAVCPGPMRTAFLDAAGIPGNSKTFETLPYDSPEHVAKAAIRAAIRGQRVITPKPLYKLYRVLAKLVPHRLMMKISKT